MPKISVLVPVYNVENYLRECLDSLLAQTFSDFELICMNDGSTDSSLSILQEYAVKDSRVRLFDKKNEGYGKTMNRCLAEARAPYIGIVESDDFVKPQMFERLYETMTEEPVDLVKCNFYKYTVQSGMNGSPSPEYQEDVYGKVIKPIDWPDIYFANSSIWAALYDKAFLDRNKIRFNETPGASYQDISFQFKVLSCATRMKVIADALLYYRTDNLMSSVHSPFKIYCICDEIHEIEAYIKKQDEKRQEKLWPLLAKRKYYDYRWNFGRLAEIFKFAFFEKVIAEFEADRAAGKFDKVDWLSPNDRLIFERMMENPMDYFMKKIKKIPDNRLERINTVNKEFTKMGFLSILRTDRRLIVYGAGKVGRYVAKRLKALGACDKNILFAVTDTRENESEVDGIIVKQIKEALEENENAFVLVAAKGEKQMEMLNYLLYLNYQNIILVDDNVLSYLREE